MNYSFESVHFELANGTTVAVESSEYRRVYDELWMLSKHMPGCVTTARLLLTGADHRSNVKLDDVQSAALRRAMSGSETRASA
jgi:hypothetical protein